MRLLCYLPEPKIAVAHRKCNASATRACWTAFLYIALVYDRHHIAQWYIRSVWILAVR